MSGDIERLLTIDVLAAMPDVASVLAWPYDFDISTRQSERVWVRVVDASAPSVLASDAAGGLFLLCAAAEGPLVAYVSSEGQGGIITAGLSECIRLLITVPYWRDLLKFSGGGQQQEMLRAQPLLERELVEDTPEIPSQRGHLIERLGLALLDDPVSLLHQRVSAGVVAHKLVSEDGDELESLFNTFVVSDNPMWRGAG